MKSHQPFVNLSEGQPGMSTMLRSHQPLVNQGEGQPGMLTMLRSHLPLVNQGEGQPGMSTMLRSHEPLVNQGEGQPGMSTMLRSHQPLVNQGEGQPVGPNVPIPTTPGRLFALFFTTQIVDIIVTETNRYAEQVMNRYAEQVMGCNAFAISAEVRAGVLHPNVYCSPPRTKRLLEAKQVPQLRPYCKQDIKESFYVDSKVGVLAMVEHHVFAVRYLHFTNNDNLLPRGHPGYDKLGKVLLILELFNTQFQSVYDPHCEITVDESMIKFHGRSGIKIHF